MTDNKITPAIKWVVIFLIAVAFFVFLGLILKHYAII